MIHQRIAPATTADNFRILSDSVAYFATYYLDGRTRPHVEPQLRCPGCLESRCGRRYGYLAVMEAERPTPFILQITQSGADNSETLRKHDGDLRGRTIRCFRVSLKEPTKRSPARYLVSERKALDGLPPAFDLVFHLMRLWGYGHLYREWLKMGRPEYVQAPCQPDLPLSPLPAGVTGLDPFGANPEGLPEVCE